MIRGAHESSLAVEDEHLGLHRSAVEDAESDPPRIGGDPLGQWHVRRLAELERLEPGVGPTDRPRERLVAPEVLACPCLLYTSPSPRD